MRLFSFGISLAGAIGSGALGLSWLRAAPSDFSSVAIAGYLLVLSLVLGCIGGMLILQRRDRFAAPLLLAIGLAPGLAEPKAFVVTFLLVLAAFLTTGRASPATG
jgi:hypothetical protein